MVGKLTAGISGVAAGKIDSKFGIQGGIVVWCICFMCLGVVGNDRLSMGLPACAGWLPRWCCGDTTTPFCRVDADIWMGFWRSQTTQPTHSLGKDNELTFCLPPVS